MPRPTLPPTPASSTDIKGKDGDNLSSLQLAFELPPPALTITSDQPSPPDSRSTKSLIPSPYPLQASEAVKARRRSSATREPPTASKEAFALPPPPTRSRKIIQMKPPRQEEEGSGQSGSVAGSSSGAVPGGKAGGKSTATAAGGRKKQPSATSAAGRKIARKTAHSLIERRRRSKMNEEFSVLKNMIPACTGEMHKLAILQASIEYVRYLEDCVSKLKAQRDVPSDRSEFPTPSGQDLYAPDRHFAPSYASDPSAAGDTEMIGSGAPSPVFAPPRSHQSSISPALQAQDSRHRQDSYSSVSTDQRYYSYSASATTSPAFGPKPYGYARTGGTTSSTGSTLTSPALQPQRDLDQEATAALLMLNSDRRSVPNAGGGSGVGRGMSVKDLLSA